MTVPLSTQNAEVKRSKSDVSRERLLEAAARTFFARGYSGATMRDIAHAAGMKAGSLYYYYSSKDELIEAVVEMAIHHVSTSVYEAVAALPPEAGSRERLREAIRAHLVSLLRHGTYTSLSRHLLAQVPPEVRRRHVEQRDAYSDFWLELLTEAVAAGEIRDDVDIRLTRTFLLGSLNAALDWYRPDGKSIPELAEEFTKILGEGLFRGPATAP